MNRAKLRGENKQSDHRVFAIICDNNFWALQTMALDAKKVHNPLQESSVMKLQSISLLIHQGLEVFQLTILEVNLALFGDSG